MNRHERNSGGGRGLIRSVLTWMILAIGMLVLVACGTPTTATQKGDTSIPEAAGDAANSMRLALLPLKDMNAVYGENRAVPSPITGKVFMTGPVAEGATTLLEGLILQHLGDGTERHVLPPERTAGVYEQVLSGAPAPSSDREAVVWMGRRLGVDAVIVGHVFRFRERRGSHLAVDSPASIAFDMQLVLADNGRIAWNGSVDETQSALSDDLFQIGKFLQRQGRWVTAEAMANGALSRMFASFPKP